MSNLDVAVASFWQLARHWNQGGKAKLELSCEDGNLHMQLSADLGHPDQPHFPHPPHPPPPPSFPPPKTRKKSPSQLRRQERRQREARRKAEEADSLRNIIEEPDNVFSDSGPIKVVLEAYVDNTSEKNVENPADDEGKIVYRRTQMNAIALQKLTLDWANMKNWTNLSFAMLVIILKSVVTVRRN